MVSCGLTPLVESQENLWRFLYEAIAQGRDGNLYSSTDDQWEHGINGGTAFRITPAGTLTGLHYFSVSDGQGPAGGLTLGTDGNYYGTNGAGGLYSFGTIFKITAGGALTTLHNFTGADGWESYAPPIEGFDGNFYGTTSLGSAVDIDYGSVYKITPSGAFTILHSFKSISTDVLPIDGGQPIGPLVQATDGYFYGTALEGGTYGVGTIFRISASGNFKILFNFNFDVPHGSYPFAPLIQGTDGNFYGVASNGGSAGGGVVFKMTPSGSLTVLHNFTGGSDGRNEVGGLVQATDGNFYGTNSEGGAAGWGVLFRITSTGAFKVLHNFEWNTGASPHVTLLQHTNGTLYSTTVVGGNNGQGTFYSFDVGLGPFVRFLPEARAVGHTIQFLGQGFTGTTAVSFNGTPALFTVISDKYLTATVPDGATTGFVTVTTPSGALTSNKKFQVRPHIFSFSPASGPAGTTTVVIKGDSLKQTTVVKFDGVTAPSFTVDSNWQVTATVPSGAKTGKISITTTGAPTYTSTTFTVTP